MDDTQIILEDLDKNIVSNRRFDEKDLKIGQKVFGYTQEDIKLLMSPMAVTGQEAIGSMGTDTPISAMSEKPKLLCTYFKQNFAQVTNPPIDPIREESVMSLVSFIGPRSNLFDRDHKSAKKRLEVRQPILRNSDLKKIRDISEIGDSQFVSQVLDITYRDSNGASGMEECILKFCHKAETAVLGGSNIIILSDRQFGRDRIAVPALFPIATLYSPPL